MVYVVVGVGGGVAGGYHGGDDEIFFGHTLRDTNADPSLGKNLDAKPTIQTPPNCWQVTSFPPENPILSGEFYLVEALGITSAHRSPQAARLSFVTERKPAVPSSRLMAT